MIRAAAVLSAGIAVVALLFFLFTERSSVQPRTGQERSLTTGGQDKNKSSRTRSTSSARKSKQAAKKDEPRLTEAQAAEKYPEFFEEFGKALAMTDRKARLEALHKIARKAPSHELLRMIIPIMMASGEPGEVWNKLRDLYYSVDLPALPAVAEAMKSMSVPAYFTVSVESIAARNIDPARQVFAVRELGAMSLNDEHPTPPIQSSLAYTALDNPSAEVRSATLSTLGEIGDNTITGRLSEYIAGEPDAVLRASAEGVRSAVAEYEPEY